MNLRLSDSILPLTLRPAVRLSDEDLLRLSLDNHPYKLERTAQGEITVMTPVGGIGGTQETYVASQLFLWAEDTGRGIAFGSNTGFNLPDGSCLAPDAAWLSLPRWRALTPEEQAGYPPLCPEFVIEIRSRSDARPTLEAKMQLWMQNGAELAWLLDPANREVILYRPDTDPETISAPDQLAGTGSVEGFTLNTGRLW